jgi:hypothetical protein
MRDRSRRRRHKRPCLSNRGPFRPTAPYSGDLRDRVAAALAAGASAQAASGFGISSAPGAVGHRISALVRVLARCPPTDGHGQQRVRGLEYRPYRLADVLPIRWLGEHQPLPVALSEERWDASELRASAVMAGFTGFVLPMLLGLLGAFT